MKMVSGLQLYLFLPFLLYSTTGTGEEVAQTVTAGDDHFLPCPGFEKYNNTKKMDVIWMRNGIKFCSYAFERNRTNIYKIIYKCVPRFKTNISGLTIKHVTHHDAGLYNCSLIQLIPPPVTYLGDSTLKLQVEAGLILQRINSSDLSCVELLCSLDSWSLQEVTFTWTTASQQLPHHTNNTTTSTLKLCKPDWNNGDTVTCRASNLSKHLLYQRNITLSTLNSADSVDSVDSVLTTPLWLIIVSAVSSCVGLILIIFLAVAIHRCKKRNAENGMVVISNKIYANFTLSTIQPNPVSITETSVRPNSRPSPQRVCQSQNEESIYEN